MTADGEAAVLTVEEVVAVFGNTVLSNIQILLFCKYHTVNMVILIIMVVVQILL